MNERYRVVVTQWFGETPKWSAEVYDAGFEDEDDDDFLSGCWTLLHTTDQHASRDAALAEADDWIRREAAANDRRE